MRRTSHTAAMLSQEMTAEGVMRCLEREKTGNRDDEAGEMRVADQILRCVEQGERRATRSKVRRVVCFDSPTNCKEWLKHAPEFGHADRCAGR